MTELSCSAEPRRKTVHALKADKEAYVRGICEVVEYHLWSSDSHPDCRGICTLRSSKPVPRCTAVRAEGGGVLTEESKVKARWAGYLERLYQADPTAVELDIIMLCHTGFAAFLFAILERIIKRWSDASNMPFKPGKPHISTLSLR